MRRYRQKPPEVDAFQFSLASNPAEVEKFCASKPFHNGVTMSLIVYGDDTRYLVRLGDWVIKNASGRKWVETNEQFQRNWEDIENWQENFLLRFGLCARVSIMARKHLDTGGPAFPILQRQGMTLLDKFADSAMSSMVAGEGAIMVAKRDERYRDGPDGNWAEIVALNAYEIAEAMVKEKRRREGS